MPTANSTNRLLSTRLLRYLLDNWPRLQIVRRGYMYVIVRPFGRLVCYAKGPHGIQWALREIEKPATVIPFRPRLVIPEPLPLWKERINWINAKCEEVKQRSATSA